MKTTTVKGTNDYLPEEAKLRDYLQDVILRTYSAQGFQRIYTPILEDLENLEHSDGGDNLSLIFKVMKRGDKLSQALQNGDSLADLGLRYDLTLPLTRFYAEHNASLPSPFKVIQIDRVYRAERPQKGRDREFVQCDIDILGSKSVNCEIELIHTTATALLNIGLKNFVIAINDRRILHKVLSSCGFDDEALDSVCITFDKLDKIGVDGVVAELKEKGFGDSETKRFAKLLAHVPKTFAELKLITGEMEEINNLQEIMSSVESLSCGKYSIEFDLSLVRGQGYYTGTVFEIKSSDYHCSIGGGGRYDNLIGKFTGEQICAVGFSIGFERIYSIVKEKKLANYSRPKLAIIYGEDNFVPCMKYAETQKELYDCALFEMPKKFGKLLAKLEENGFESYVVLAEGEHIKPIKK